MKACKEFNDPRKYVLEWLKLTRRTFCGKDLFFLMTNKVLCYLILVACKVHCPEATEVKTNRHQSKERTMKEANTPSFSESARR